MIISIFNQQVSDTQLIFGADGPAPFRVSGVRFSQLVDGRGGDSLGWPWFVRMPGIKAGKGVRIVGIETRIVVMGNRFDHGAGRNTNVAWSFPPDTELLYRLNWMDPNQWRNWTIELSTLRQLNAHAWQVLTYRIHQLYDVRVDGANVELFTRGHSDTVLDLGFGHSLRQVNPWTSLYAVPRYSEPQPMVVSAGPDDEFGLYIPEANNPQGDRPIAQGKRAAMWAALQIDYRCGRVDARTWRFVLDNITNLDLQPPADLTRFRRFVD